MGRGLERRKLSNVLASAERCIGPFASLGRFLAVIWPGVFAGFVSPGDAKPRWTRSGAAGNAGDMGKTGREQLKATLQAGRRSEAKLPTTGCG